MLSSRELLIEQAAQQTELLSRLESDPLSLIGFSPKQLESMQSDSKMTMTGGANQYAGKTTCSCAAATYHYTGLYPEWWTGPRWDFPIQAAFCAQTKEKLRDTIQDRLFGAGKENLGTGFIPSRCIDPDRITWGTGDAKGVILYAEVKHFNQDGRHDGWTRVWFFSFAMGWERVSGYTLHDVRISEEPDLLFHDEMRARTNATGGKVYVDMVPLLGETELYLSYEQGKAGARRLITIDIDDCLHIPKELRDAAKAEYADDPWAEARLHGKPVRGMGLIFKKPIQDLMFDPRNNWPFDYKAIIGIDIPHTSGAFAAVKLIYCAHQDVVFVTEGIKVWDTSREVQAERIRALGGDLVPVAWPHDAGQEDRVSGSTVADRYRRLGCNMCPHHAYFETYDGRKVNAIQDAIDEVIDRERSGRIRYSHEVHELIHERSQYAHEKGKVKREQDDHLLDALFKGIMMLRFARELGSLSSRRRSQEGLRAEFRVRADSSDFFSI